MLSGFRIIEFEGLGPCPFAGMMLAQMGAEVIVVHRPGPAGGAAKTDRSLLDRGKKSIALDLKSPDDLRIARAVMGTADAVIEGFRPGVMERLGLGPGSALAANPRLVFGRMTGWGQSGPRAHQAGHDLAYLGVAGALFHSGLPGDVPAVTPTLMGDIGGGALYLVAGVLAGLLAAQRSGKGTVVDAAIVDGAAHMMTLLMSMGEMFDADARGTSLLDGPYWSRAYACSDKRHIAVQCLEPQFHAIFLDRLGLTDDSAFSAQYDPAGWPEATRVLERLFAEHPQAHWARLFDGTDACVAPVLSPAQSMRDPHMLARGTWQDGVPAAAPRFSTATGAASASPERDAHRNDILNDLKRKGLL